MVDFTLTDEQKSLREMAHDFAVKEIRPVAWEYDKEGTWPEEIIAKAWEVGLMNSHIGEEYGGTGAGYPQPVPSSTRVIMKLLNRLERELVQVLPDGGEPFEDVGCRGDHVTAD